MELEFANGSEGQQEGWRRAVNRLLNLSPDALPLGIAVSFVDPSEVAEHTRTDLAATDWTYGSSTSVTRVRDDAPNFGPEQQAALRAEAAKFGLTFSSALMYAEVAVHELGHAAFASLSDDRRLEIARMFGADSDDLDELSPDGAEWEDKIIEGIAETFKEAFMPRRYRVFGNRTNRSISYALFPEFRALFRTAVEETSGDGTPLPAYNMDVFRVDYQASNRPVFLTQEDVSAFDIYSSPSADGEDGGLATPFPEGWVPPYIEANFNMAYQHYEARSSTPVMFIPRGTRFAARFNLDMPLSYFGPSQTEGPLHAGEYVPGSGGFGGIYTLKQWLENHELSGDPEKPLGGTAPANSLGWVEVHLSFAYLDFDTNHWIAWDNIKGKFYGAQNIHSDTAWPWPAPKWPDPDVWFLIKDGFQSVYSQSEGWSDPPIGEKMIDSVVPPEAPVVDTCGGPMAEVQIFARIWWVADPLQQYTYDQIQARIPSFELHRPAGPCTGDAITIPGGHVLSGGHRAGRLPSDDRILGART